MAELCYNYVKTSVRIYLGKFQEFHDCIYDKKVFLHQVQKVEHINWHSFGILHAD